VIARGGEVESRGRQVRRFWSRSKALAREHNIRLKVAAQIVRDEEQRARQTLREIRSDVRKAVRS
jgi:replicative DNA helicase